jgi:hypothetical protein
MALKTLSGLAQSLGLPRDALSAVILSFARYFSLSLNPDLMAKIRRESLSAVPSESSRKYAPPPVEAPAGQEAQNAAAFAAAAAAAKGLELSREGLAVYAAAIDPDYPENSGDSAENSDGGAAPGQNSGGDSGPGNRENGKEGSGPSGNFGGGPRGGLDQDDLTGPDTLREKVLEIEGPLLGFLNRMPGKNGEPWISLPFAFTQGDMEYRVSLHISAGASFSTFSPCRLVMDISGGPRDKPVLRWFFLYDKFAGEEARLRARFWPPEDKKALKSFQKELSRLFSLQMNKINLQNNDEYTSYIKNYADDILPTINEEV